LNYEWTLYVITQKYSLKNPSNCDYTTFQSEKGKISPKPGMNQQPKHAQLHNGSLVFLSRKNQFKITCWKIKYKNGFKKRV